MKLTIGEHHGSVKPGRIRQRAGRFWLLGVGIVLVIALYTGGLVLRRLPS